MPVPLVRRELRHRPGRVALLVATVTVAVAFTTAAFGFAAQVSVQLDPQDTDLGSLTLPEGTVVVTPRTTGITTATSIDETLLQTVRSTPGVLTANGVYDQPVSFAVSAEEQPDRPVQLRGLVLSSAWDPQRWTVVDGRAPESPDEVAVDIGGSIVGRAELGARPALELPTGTRRVEVVGLVAPPDGSSAPADAPRSVAEVALASAHVVLPAAHAADLLGAAGKVDRLTVLPAQGVDPRELAATLRETLPAGLEVLTLTDRSQSVQTTVAGLDSGVRGAVTGFALLTVAIAALAVANVYTVVLAQRTRELALLRLVGARRSQLARTVLGEALVVGALGATCGLGAGAVLGWAAVTAVDPIGVRASIAVTLPMVAAALAVGVAVTLLGAAVPALRVTRTVPLDAISDTGAGADRSAPWWSGAVLVALGGSVSWTALVAGGLAGPGWQAAAGAGLLAAMVGLAMLSRWAVVPLSGAAALPAVALGGVTARLGLGNVRRRPARSAAAASTLMVTLALVGVVGTTGASARDNVEAQFRNTGPADLFVERRGLVRVDTRSLFSEMRETFDLLHDGAEVVSLEGVLVGPDGEESQVATSGLGRLARMIDLGITGGDPDDPVGSDIDAAGDGAPDGAMLSERSAERLGVGVGDPLTLRSASGKETRVRVVATYRNTAFVGPAVVAWPATEEVDAEGTFELAALDVSDGASVRRAMRRAEDAASGFPKVRVHTPEEFSELNTSVADTVLKIIAVLLVGSVGIGMLGLASTLALSTHERRRELVMLRAVGASRSQIRSLVGVEAAMIGAIAAVLGLAAGTLTGWAATALAPGDLVERTIVPWLGLAAVATAAVVVSWLVSLGVANRAARVPPAEAGREL